MKDNFFIVLLLFFQTLICSSCQQKRKSTSDDWKKYSSEIILNHIGKPIQWSDSIVSFTNSKYKIWNENDIVLLFNVDLDCSTCLAKFYFWSKFSQDFKQKHKKDFKILAIINTYTTNNLQNRVEQLWQHEWLYDPFYRFIDANKLNDERFQALLIDRNKEIILIGNPIQNIALKKLYEETIWKYIEKK